MKNIIIAFTMLFAGNAFAIEASVPNYFVCVTPVTNELAFTYSASSRDGQPLVNFYNVDSKKNELRKGSAIRFESTSIGKLVTVTVANIPDFAHKTLSLVLPSIKFAPNATTLEYKFETMLVDVSNRTSIAGPMLVFGNAQPTKFIPVSCSATKVVF